MQRKWLWLLVVGIVLGWTQVEALTRFAAQGGGGGAPCTNSGTPCPVATAIAQAVSGDTVSFLNTGGNFTSTVTVTSRTNLILTGNGTAHITTTSGNCVTISGGTGITIQAMNIGPCGATNGSGSGMGIEMTGSGHKVYDSYIHPEIKTSTNCCDTRDAILIRDGTNTIDIQGNVIAFGETNVGMYRNVSNVTIRGNYSLNPRGPRTWNSTGARGQHTQSFANGAADQNSNIFIYNNYFASRGGQAFQDETEDFTSFGWTDLGRVEDNYYRGDGGNVSLTGCNMLAEFQTNDIQFLRNIIHEGGGCGVGIAGGTNNIVNANKEVSTSPGSLWGDNGAGIAVYTNNYSSDPDCSNHTVSNNIMSHKNGAGNYNDAQGYWNGTGTCDPITLTGNTFGTAAITALSPILTTNPPPLIPPIPKNCTAVSPYTTQTSLPSCDAALAGPAFTFTASTPVSSGANSTLTWSAVTGDVSSGCTASVLSGQADTAWSTAGAGPTSAQLIAGGTKSSTARTATTVYRMTCTGTGGTTTIDQTVLVADTTAPTIPGSFSATGPTVSTINATWVASTDAVGVLGYRVYACFPSPCARTAYMTFIPGTSDVIRGLRGGQTYSLALRAFDAAGNESVDSTVQTVTTSTIPAGSPSLLLTFEEGGGPTVFDSSGSGHNSSAFTGTFSATAHEGSFGGAFSGTQEARIPRISGAGPTGLESTAVTIAAWVRRNGVQSQESAIINKTFNNNGPNTYSSYKLVLNPSPVTPLGSDFVGCEIGYVSDIVTLATVASAVPDLGWVHIACTYDPSAAAPQLKLYISGSTASPGATATQTVTINYDATANGDLYLSSNGASGERMVGTLDDVRMYPRALNPSEVAVLAGVTGGATAPAAPTNLRVVSP